MPDYGKPDYWDERYRASDTTFDWLKIDNLFTISGAWDRYLPYEPLKTLLNFMKPEHRLLIIGCGNSRLSAHMYEAGFVNIVNIDVSEVCVQQMRSRYSSMERMEWRVMDAVRLDFPDASFDVVIDKGVSIVYGVGCIVAGTTDSLLCGANSFHNVYLMNKQISRVLKKGGKYVCVTYGQPDVRIDHFRRKKLNWDVEHKTIEKPSFGSEATPTSSYHAYLMTKGEETQAEEEEGDDEDEEDDDFYDRFQLTGVSRPSE